MIFYCFYTSYVRFCNRCKNFNYATLFILNLSAKYVFYQLKKLCMRRLNWCYDLSYIVLNDIITIIYFCISMLSNFLLFQYELRNESTIYRKASAALRCFEHALELDPTTTSLWIEYGSLAYILHSHASRQLKQVLH